MVVSGRQLGSNTKLLIYWNFHTQAYLGFTEWSKKEKICSEQQLCEQKRPVDVRGQRRMSRLAGNDRKATVIQITTRLCRIPSLNAQHMKPWSRWASVTENHIESHFCQLSTGQLRLNSHRLTKTGQQKIGKTNLIWWVTFWPYQLWHSGGRVRIT